MNGGEDVVRPAFAEFIALSASFQEQVRLLNLNELPRLLLFFHPIFHYSLDVSDENEFVFGLYDSNLCRTLRTAVRMHHSIFINGWDVAGGAGFGFKTLWVNRAKEPVDRLAHRPWKIANDLTNIPNIIEADK